MKRVLKLVPKSFYTGQEAKFSAEVDNHFQAAENAEFVVQITEEPFEETVFFGSEKVECYCIEMEYIDGYVLDKLYDRSVELTPEIAIQLTCDLLNLLRELHQKRLNHNDLHAGNVIVQRLPPGSYRADAIEKGVRAVAIDLGSADSQRREGQSYLSDIQWVSKHMLGFSEILSSNNLEKSDLRARLAFYLRHLALELSAPQANQADQDHQDFVERIREAYSNARKRYHRAWASPLNLSSLSQHRNAQTLESWHVPTLMVDPEQKWHAELNSGGPVIITGMRGCGKTMLLRSLELHARIVATKEEQLTQEARKAALFGDGYLGVYASARHLGVSSDTNEKGEVKEDRVAQFFAKLFLVYSSRICDALNHLEEEFQGTVDTEAAHRLAGVIFGQVNRDNPIERTDSLDDLQTQLLVDAELWSSNHSSPVLKTEPWQSFVLLAKAVQNVLIGSREMQIAFLLDDVSTRYLDQEEIELVVSTLLVQEPACSFKITSETQTFFLSIKSPGQINLASGERDYLPFDLGSKVLEQLKDPKSGESFLESILSRRMKALGGELANLSPKQILGNASLVSIARKISLVSNFSAPPEGIYHGFSALRGVCIGDLGTIIALYQEILRSARPDRLPVPSNDQHRVYQTFCSNQLFQLNSRDQRLKTDFSLKKVALDFADASHQELLASNRSEKDRLRQITSMNVTLVGNDTEQTKKLLELVDAGVFALHPRKFASRSKSSGSDPVQQFQLSYRKILGISKLIGLSDRDRFELNGQQLLEWLKTEDGAKNLRAHTRRFGAAEEGEATKLELHAESPTNVPEDAAKEPELPFPEFKKSTSIRDVVNAHGIPRVRTIELEEAPCIQNLVVSLGFEERCLPSAKRLAHHVRPKNIVAIEYGIPGKLTETQQLAKEVGASFQKVRSDELNSGVDIALHGKVLIDASGLTKPAIFKLIKESFTKNGEVWAAITEPNEYQPTETDLSAAIGDGVDFWGDAGVETLSEILSGDKLPYGVVVVEELHSDPSRNRKLCAFSSAKHGRLLHLVEEVTYDEIDVFVPSGDSYRHKVAQKSASIATRSGELGSAILFSADDPSALLAAVFENHLEAYQALRSNYEIALTGGKLETMVSGIAAAVLPVNRVVYVRPAEFDAENFSKGVGRTKVYEFKSNGSAQ
ncbi:hypothetical protein EU805_17105 [Salipiger sp. IMCC34102]|uniref:ORC-CDC6 family AAA ATPase n=1 Tax=Salipiger sp. IMCC34102 TaxID=2510647 RepID=UPI00101E0E98|nr:hypothetical protein [Salipiger sp. IMCC34102]RYH00682.1 hypothetical protein EU805_17105 [Salipiger sp. IMCC34102]